MWGVRGSMVVIYSGVLMVELVTIQRWFANGYWNSL
jgi:hypothetical protein